MSTSRPVFKGDFFGDRIILDPYPCYRLLRDMAPAVWLSSNDAWVIGRYQDVHDSLLNADVFISGKGVTLNPALNEGMAGNMVNQDDPAHLEMRKVFIAPLLPKSLSAIRGTIQEAADNHVRKLVERGQFDAVSDLAYFLPLTIVTELVGLDDEGKENMLNWAAGVFNAFGPPGNARTQSGMVTVQELLGYIFERLTPDKLIPGGWAARLFDCADQAMISKEQATSMMIDYLVPSLDTTINATSSALWLFGQNPGQWELLRARQSLVPNAINEVLRMESPIRAFARCLATDYILDGVELNEGSRALMLYASGNRDERKFEDPDRFDITRENARDHLGFGQGTHICPGSSLARLEISCLLEALVTHVGHIECAEPSREPHNILRGIRSMTVSVS